MDGTVRPLAGAGIEIVGTAMYLNANPFAPSRGRELKSVFCNLALAGFVFAPSRGRELKYTCGVYL